MDVCLSWLHQDSELAVAVSREHAYNQHLDSSSQFYCFEKSEIIHEYTPTFLMQKDFPYFNELNRFIQRASAAGLIDKWHTDVKTPTYSRRKGKSYRQIKLQNFYGVYIIWFTLQLLVLVTFLLERFIHKKMKAHQPSRVWILAQMYIDPERHFLLETKVI